MRKPPRRSPPPGTAVRTGVSRGDLDPGNPTIRYFNSGANVPYKNPGVYELGTAAFYQNGFRNPPALTENISIMKAFTVMERFHFKFRADAFNVFNRTCFGVNGSFTAADFGRATGPQSGPRVVTVGLRLDF